MSSTLLIEESELNALKLEAATGDPVSAMRVSLHYSMLRGGRSNESRYWLLIAAENGNVAAQYSMWTYDKDGDAISRARALFWLRRAAEGGDAMAHRELRRLEEVGELQLEEQRPD